MADDLKVGFGPAKAKGYKIDILHVSVMLSPLSSGVARPLLLLLEGRNLVPGRCSGYLF